MKARVEVANTSTCHLHAQKSSPSPPTVQRKLQGQPCLTSTCNSFSPVKRRITLLVALCGTRPRGQVVDITARSSDFGERPVDWTSTTTTTTADMKQAKQAKVATGQTIRDKAKERAALNRDVVKPVFASPFTVPW